jgi:hypothetical protein
MKAPQVERAPDFRRDSDPFQERVRSRSCMFLAHAFIVAP